MMGIIKSIGRVLCSQSTSDCVRSFENVTLVLTSACWKKNYYVTSAQDTWLSWIKQLNLFIHAAKAAYAP